MYAIDRSGFELNFNNDSGFGRYVGPELDEDASEDGDSAD